MIEVARNTVHPWSGAPGWDRMTIMAGSVVRAVELSYEGRKKMWHLFFQDGQELVMYKPSGATDEWDDDEHWLGHDKEKARLLQPGDVVYTNFSGAVTRHKIVDRKSAATSSSGVSVRVTPDVQRSGGGWMDAGWFRKVLQ